MIKCNSCGEFSPNDATFCIECGKSIIVANTGATHRLDDTKTNTSLESLYYIYKAELGTLLKDNKLFIQPTDKGSDIYYHGRKVVFMD